MPLLSQTATGSRRAAARYQVSPNTGRQGVIESSRRDPRDARSRACVPPQTTMRAFSAGELMSLRAVFGIAALAVLALLPAFFIVTNDARSPSRGHP